MKAFFGIVLLSSLFLSGCNSKNTLNAMDYESINSSAFLPPSTPYNPSNPKPCYHTSSFLPPDSGSGTQPKPCPCTQSVNTKALIPPGSGSGCH
ncbi:MAG: hypothetical protein U0354_19030 [Candidatus Sericytochromatia bacterium]